MVRRRVKSKARSPTVALEGDLRGDPDLTRLEENLVIDAAELDDQLASQPRWYYAAALSVVRAESQRDRFEAEYQSTLVRTEALIRDAASGRSEDVSEAQIEHRVASHADVASSLRRLNRARHDARVSEALRAAYEQRYNVILALVSKSGN